MSRISYKDVRYSRIAHDSVFEILNNLEFVKFFNETHEIVKVKREDANSLEWKRVTKRISRTILKRLLGPSCNSNRDFVYVNGGSLVRTL